MLDVEVVSFGRLLGLQPLWDLVHIDIQGTEAELCTLMIGSSLNRPLRIRPSPRDHQFPLQRGLR